MPLYSSPIRAIRRLGHHLHGAIIGFGESFLNEVPDASRLRALIACPADGKSLPRGETAIRGVAWSGAGSISRVEVSLNDGSWREARLVGERRRGAWQWWELITRLGQTGSLAVRARATDMAGRTQPERAEWNRLGYGNNSVHSATAQVV
jgi:hypothetical protein